jgi:hypothetical protein
VLGLAGNSAGVAADALSVVDYEAKIHYRDKKGKLRLSEF